MTIAAWVLGYVAAATLIALWKLAIVMTAAMVAGGCVWVPFWAVARAVYSVRPPPED